MTYNYEETDEFAQYIPSDDGDSKKRRLATVAVGALLAGAIMVWIGVILTGGNGVSNASQPYGTVGTAASSGPKNAVSNPQGTAGQAVYPDPKGDPASPAGKPKPGSKSIPTTAAPRIVVGVDSSPTARSPRAPWTFFGGSAIVVTFYKTAQPPATNPWPDETTEPPTDPTPTGPIDTGNEPPFAGPVVTTAP